MIHPSQDKMIIKSHFRGNFHSVNVTGQKKTGAINQLKKVQRKHIKTY
jgi:hypothetical protein